MTDPVTTIREALQLGATLEEVEAGRAALTELEQQLRTYKSATAYATDRAEGAEHERDRLAHELEAAISLWEDEKRVRFPAEAERDQLADTLREIAALTPYVDASSTSSVVKAPSLARAALDRQQP